MYVALSARLARLTTQWSSRQSEDPEQAEKHTGAASSAASVASKWRLETSVRILLHSRGRPNVNVG